MDQRGAQVEQGVASSVHPDPAPTHPKAQSERQGEIAVVEVPGLEVGQPEQHLVGEALDGLLLDRLEPHSRHRNLLVSTSFVLEISVLPGCNGMVDRVTYPGQRGRDRG